MRIRANVARNLGILAAVAAIGVAADATLVEPFRMTISRVVLPPGMLASALGGARIAHLSDLHLKGMGSRERRLLEALRESEPALVVMTGDYADTPEGIGAISEVFSRISPRLGILAVPGNNDYYRGRQEEIFGALRSAGVRILRNESTLLQGDGGPFAVAGVDDPFFGRDDVRASLREIPEGIPTVLLAHSPSVLIERSDAMLFNAGDADGPWGKGWFWTDGSHFRDPMPNIRFDSTGSHRLLIQRREDGVGIGAIHLVPAGAGEIAREAARGMQGEGKRPPVADGQIQIDFCAPERVATRGSWRLEREDEAGCVLRDEPDFGRFAASPEVDPDDRAEVTFEAPAGTSYRVWVRLHSPTSTGLSDSFHLQFGDATDETGRPVFRIGTVTPPAAGQGLDLILAGHTHGGQVRLPWIGAIEHRVALGPFIMGRYDVSGTMVYVSRGIGTSYLPVRFACAPEVVLLEPPRGGDAS